MNEVQEKLNHLEWAIQSRARNQQSALRLLTLFKNHEKVWKTKKFSRAAQDLIAVSFSLWRAAFLADKSGRRAVVFAQGRDFLEKVIEDNTISYPQDKTSKEWTFNYYTRNARSSLQELAKHWDGVASKYEGKTRKPQARWDYCQNLLDEAVTKFEKLFEERQAARERVQQVQKTRRERSERRKKVREMALAERTGSAR